MLSVILSCADVYEQRESERKRKAKSGDGLLGSEDSEQR